MTAILVAIAAASVIGILWYEKGYKDAKSEYATKIKAMYETFVKGEKNHED